MMRGIAVALLIPFLWGYLCTGLQIQLFADLAEIAEHASQTPNTESYQSLTPQDLAHHCHSCVVSHPNFPLSPALQNALEVNLDQTPKTNLRRQIFVPAHRFDQTNTRSPPVSV